MGRNNFWNIVGIVLLVMVLLGVVSVGDILGLVFRIIVGFIIFIAIVWLFIRYKLRKVEREMGGSGRQGNANGSARTYYYNRSSRRAPEGDVTINKGSTQTKGRVNKKVGDYVDYEEM